MSFGFHRHPRFRLIAAADAEIGKPSMGRGSLQCNRTYEANMGIKPAAVDLGRIEPGELRQALGLGAQKVTVLSVCPPCTGFSRANPLNHVRDDHRNSLVGRAAEFATALDVDIVVMENARELLTGNFKGHFLSFSRHLEENGYRVHAAGHMLTRFGLPQIRERALAIGVKKNLPLRTMADLWEGLEVRPEACTVRAALGAIPADCPGMDVYPKFSDKQVLNRLKAIPPDGGSWTDLLTFPGGCKLLTDAMKRRIEQNRLGSHPDVYGRMPWDKPAPTIKRECSHIGNGRYAHPVENRLCSVREMAVLQGFPVDFQFSGSSVSNHYRHIGDAVPPLVSHQIAWLCDWILGNSKPRPDEWILKGTHLQPDDVVETGSTLFAYA
ncbi:MAG: DNA cytosine methyltransferase [Verrucomicrobia bacterium]|nr:DNA cytosine methyltransferase [Verrucomicrobiota bacterium]